VFLANIPALVGRFTWASTIYSWFSRIEAIRVPWNPMMRSEPSAVPCASSCRARLAPDLLAFQAGRENRFFIAEPVTADGAINGNKDRQGIIAFMGVACDCLVGYRRRRLCDRRLRCRTFHGSRRLILNS
jgi:hypothetical protein